MYRNSLERLRAGIGSTSTPEQPQEKTRGLVRPPSEPVEDKYNPMAFVEQAMQRLRSARKAPIEEPAKQRRKPKPFVEFAQEEDEIPVMEESINEDGIRTTKGAEAYGLVKRPEAKAGAGGFLGLMDKHEGGGDYSALLGFSNRNEFKGVDVTQMTLAEIDQFARGRYAEWSKDWKRRKGHGNASIPSTPMGRYQFVNTTLQAQARKMGLDPNNTRFTPEVQDAMFENYLSERMARGSTPEEKMAQVRQAWEGFRNVPDARLLALINKMGS